MSGYPPCADCGAPVKFRDRDRCHVCHRKAAAAALKRSRPRCGRVRHLRPAGICAICDQAAGPARPVKIITCRECGQQRRNAGHGLCNRCKLADPDWPFRYGASLGARLPVIPPWWQALIEFTAARYHPGGAVTILRLAGRVLAGEPGAGPRQIMAASTQQDGIPDAAGRALAAFFTSQGTDSRHLRTLLAEGRLPECWIPPADVLEYRALLETYHDLRRERTAWAQRIHAVLFHQGAPQLGDGALRSEQGLVALREVSAACLSPAGQLQIAIALDMIAALEARLDMLRKQLLAAARHLTGAKVLATRLYGVGPVTALALTCWLGGAGRFSSSRKAVRFTGLDVTVWSSDRKGPPGRLSRQGPPVLRWAVYEAGKTHARSSAPDHAYYAAVKDRKNSKRAALSEARKIVRQACHILTELGDDAFTAA
jgi:transposase